jgi:hypothetical protein
MASPARRRRDVPRQQPDAQQIEAGAQRAVGRAGELQAQAAQADVQPLAALARAAQEHRGVVDERPQDLEHVRRRQPAGPVCVVAQPPVRVGLVHALVSGGQVAALGQVVPIQA